jgi:predicted ATP-dependent endonuclease of OLD family
VKLSGLAVENFRSYETTSRIDIDDKLIIVGENNAGKSNLLHALSYALDTNTTKPHDREDFHDDNTAENAEITLWLDELTEKERDTFAEYVFDGELRVEVVLPYDDETNSVDTKDYYVRKEVVTKNEFRTISNKKADEKIRIYRKHESVLSEYKSEVNWTGENGASAERVVEAYIESGDAEMERRSVSPQGIQTDLEQYLPDFTLYETSRSIEEATKTKQSAPFGKLLRDAFDSVPDDELSAAEEPLRELDQRLQTDKFDALRTLEEELLTKLSTQMSQIESVSFDISIPDLRDLLVRDVSISIDDGYESKIERMGTGSQMSFILACLWELSERETDKITLGLEEPENDLHPHAQRQLYRTLDSLADDGHQIFVSTHSPDLIRPKDLSNLVRVQKRDGNSLLRTLSSGDIGQEEVDNMSHQLSTDKNDMFFSRGVLFCEGPSERVSLPAFDQVLVNSGRLNGGLDSKGISVIDVGGKKNLPKFVEVANVFNIPNAVLTDDDRSGDDEDADRDHQALLDKLRPQTDECIQLDEDLEYELFRAASVEQFATALRRASDSEIQPESVQQAIEGQPEKERAVVLESLFKRQRHVSKPIFANTLGGMLPASSVPENLEDAIRRVTNITNR